MAAPVIAGHSIADGNGTSWVVDKPTGTASGDVLLALIATNTESTMSNWGGFTGVGSASGYQLSSNTDCGTHAGVLVAGGSEPSTYTFTFGASEGGVAVILRITGADNTAPGYHAWLSEESSTNTNKTAPAVTTTVNDCLIVSSFGSDPSSAITVTLGAGGTSYLDAANTDPTIAQLFIGQMNAPTAGLIAGMTATYSSGDNAGEWTVAFAPASAPAAVPKGTLGLLGVGA
jgi:hypothetical protein